MHYELLGAITASTVSALVVLPFSSYHYWFSWSRRAGVVGVLMYLLFGGVLAGGIGWGAAHLARAHPTDIPFLDGILFGLAGAVAVRADFGASGAGRSLSKQPAEQAGANLLPAFSFLRKVTSWTLGMMDKSVELQIRRSIERLDDDKLRHSALVLAERIANIGTLNDSSKKSLWARFVPSMRDLADSDPKQQQEARVRIQQFAVVFVQEQRVSNPIDMGLAESARRR